MGGLPRNTYHQFKRAGRRHEALQAPARMQRRARAPTEGSHQALPETQLSDWPRALNFTSKNTFLASSIRLSHFLEAAPIKINRKKTCPILKTPPQSRLVRLVYSPERAPPASLFDDGCRAPIGLSLKHNRVTIQPLAPDDWALPASVVGVGVEPPSVSPKPH